MRMVIRSRGSAIRSTRSATVGGRSARSSSSAEMEIALSGARRSWAMRPSARRAPAALPSRAGGGAPRRGPQPLVARGHGRPRGPLRVVRGAGAAHARDRANGGFPRDQGTQMYCGLRGPAAPPDTRAPDRSRGGRARPLPSASPPPRFAAPAPRRGERSEAEEEPAVAPERSPPSPVEVRHGDVSHAPMLDDPDEAPLCEARHHELRDLLKGRLIFEGRASPARRRPAKQRLGPSRASRPARGATGDLNEFTQPLTAALPVSAPIPIRASKARLHALFPAAVAAYVLVARPLTPRIGVITYRAEPSAIRPRPPRRVPLPVRVGSTFTVGERAGPGSNDRG